MSDKEKDIQENEESFEDIFSSIREKYNLDPFKGEEAPAAAEEEEKIFYNPEEDNEIEDFFKSREEGYNALYEEVDAKLAGVDDKVLQKEAEVFNIEFKKEINRPATEEVPETFEDVYSQSEETEENQAKDEDADVIAEDEQDENSEEVMPVYLADEEMVPDEDIESQQEVSDEYDDDFEKPEKKSKKKNSGIEILRKIIFTISIIALIGSIAWLVNDYIIQPYLIKKQNENLVNLIMDKENATPDEVVDKLNNITPAEKAVTFANLKQMNPDFKAWIVVPGADISLAVVQTTNNDKYLNTGFNGKWSSGGTAFIDCQNKAPFSDTNTVIYGHNMRDGSMFGAVRNYKSMETFKKNPYIYIYTENENYVYKIYSVFLTNAKKTDDNGYVLAYTFKNLSTDDKFRGYMEEIKTRSYYHTGVDYQAGDKIITLSTCDRTDIKDGRLVLVGRLVRENEDKEVDTSLAKVNNNPKFPAAWYEKRKRNNPYANAPKWIAS